jgi:hypothetical protein
MSDTMNSLNEQSGNQDKRAAGETISRRFLDKYAKPGFAGGPPLYCGHLGSRTELDIRLWKYVESRLTEEEEQALLSHTDGCMYCQSRIRDIAKATRESVRRPDLLLRLEKVTAKVKDSTGEFLADLLVAVGNTGKWLYGSLGAGLVLKPVPTMRGVGEGPRRGLAPAASSRERPVSSLTSSFKASTTVEGIPLSCEIRRSASNLVLSIAYSGTGLESGLRTTCSVDTIPVQPVRLRSGGTEFVVPQDSKRIEFTVYRQEQEIGCMVVEME